MTLLTAICLIGMLAPAGPGFAAVQQDAPAAPQEPAPEGPPMSDFIDVERVEMDLVLGVAVFSSEFEADPSFLGGVSFRAPLPWLSRDLLGLEEDDFGLFAGVRVSSVERDFTPPVEDDSGVVVLADVGLDYTFYRDADFRFMAQAGLQYGYFGGVTDLENGVAGLLGVSGGVNVSEGLWITATPQISVGDSGDFVFLAQVGLLVQF